jgi:hypothetical protein
VCCIVVKKRSIPNFKNNINPNAVEGFLKERYGYYKEEKYLGIHKSVMNGNFIMYTGHCYIR